MVSVLLGKFLPARFGLLQLALGFGLGGGEGFGALLDGIACRHYGVFLLREQFSLPTHGLQRLLLPGLLRMQRADGCRHVGHRPLPAFQFGILPGDLALQLCMGRSQLPATRIQ